MIELDAAVQCGELKFVCCMTEDQMLRWRDLTLHMSKATCQRIYRYICCQSGGLTQQTTPSPSTGSDTDPCTQRVITALCDPSVQEKLAVVGEALDALLIGDQEPNTRALLLALVIMINSMHLACFEKNVTVKIMNGWCLSFNAFDKQPAWLKLLIGSFTGLANLAIFSAGPLHDAIQACCVNRQVALTSDNTPGWADVISTTSAVPVAPTNTGNSSPSTTTA